MIKVSKTFIALLAVILYVFYTYNNTMNLANGYTTKLLVDIEQTNTDVKTRFESIQDVVSKQLSFIKIQDKNLYDCLDENVRLWAKLSILNENRFNARVTDIETVRCPYRKIKSLEGIQAFKKIKYLYLDHNKFNSIKPIQKIQSIKKISLAGIILDNPYELYALKHAEEVTLPSLKNLLCGSINEFGSKLPFKSDYKTQPIRDYRCQGDEKWARKNNLEEIKKKSNNGLVLTREEEIKLLKHELFVESGRDKYRAEAYEAMKNSGDPFEFDNILENKDKPEAVIGRWDNYLENPESTKFTFEANNSGEKIFNGITTKFNWSLKDHHLNLKFENSNEVYFYRYHDKNLLEFWRIVNGAKEKKSYIYFARFSLQKEIDRLVQLYEYRKKPIGRWRAGTHILYLNDDGTGSYDDSYKLKWLQVGSDIYINQHQNFVTPLQKNFKITYNKDSRSLVGSVKVNSQVKQLVFYK